MDLFEFAAKQKAKEIEEGEPTPSVQEQIYTVAQITSEVRAAISARFGRSSVWVKGELSNFRGRNQSGHMYFSLKDDRSVLNCVFFRNVNQNIAFELKDGLEVLAFGRIDVYEPTGRYQLIIEEIRPGGVGELYLRFEQLKAKLEKEGLFDPARKRPLPAHPARIGVVTSPTGAVLRDIISVTRARSSAVSLLLFPVRVQGEGAAAEIAEAVRELNAPTHRLDLLIVGRGGGSIEDLWAFNEEIVARAIAASRLPVISAVGHQTDFTIADFVADVRAATPSQAAEIAVPNALEMRRRVELTFRNILRELVSKREVSFRTLVGLRRSPALKDPRNLLRMRQQRLDYAVERMMGRLRTQRDRFGEGVRRSREHLRWMLSQQLKPHRLTFERLSSSLALVNPLSILSRGYSVVQKENGKVVKRSADVEVGEDLAVRLKEGRLACQVTRTWKE